MRTLSDTAGRLMVEDRFLSLLESRGLDSFTALMNCTGAELVRDKGVRRILRLVIPGRSPTVLYLKQHRKGSLMDALRDLLAGKRPLSPAAREWRAISDVRAAGVETMAAVAYGESHRFSFLRPSLIVTEEIAGRRLEEYVHFLQGKLREKRCIIPALAGSVRRMHLAGLNHRDLYLSHVFLSHDGKDVRIALIDLQRVQHNARDLNRWVVKDLAALNFSSPSPAVTRADRLRFLRCYLGVRALDKRARGLIRRIARKTERIRAHDLRVRRRRGDGGSEENDMKNPLETLKTSWSTLYKTRREIQRNFPDFWDLKVRKKHLDVILEEIRDGDKILDIGSSARELRHRIVDICDRKISYKSMDIDRETKQDYYSLDEIREQFNVVFLFEVIEHLTFEDGVHLLGSIYDLLLPGGKLILTTPNAFHPNRYWEYSHKGSYRYDEIGGILISLGFQVKSIFRIYNDAFFRWLFRIWVAAPIHKYFSVDFAKSILVVASKEA